MNSTTAIAVHHPFYKSICMCMWVRVRACGCSVDMAWVGITNICNVYL